MNAGRSALAARHQRFAWLLLTPTLVVFLLVAAYPLARTFGVSLTDAQLAGQRDASFIGLANYRELLGDGDFRRALLNTVGFTLASVTLEIGLGFALALLLHQKFRGRGWVRAAVLIPWALPTVVAARLWSFMLVDTYGVINDLLVTRLGLFEDRIAWLSQPGWAMASVIAADVWKTTPFAALLILAGLQLIPDELHEAARVDGAGPFQRLRWIVLPAVLPAVLVALVFRTLDAIRVFDVVWVMTGGALGTEMLATFNYRQMIAFQRFGYGASVSVTIFALVAVFLIVYARSFRLEDRV